MDIKTIQERIRMVEETELENRQAKEMLQDSLESDEVYKDLAEQAKQATNEKKKARNAILTNEANATLYAKIQNNNEEIKTLKEILSAELADYFSKENKDEIEDASGQTRKFKINIKVLPFGKSDSRDDYGKYTKEI